MSMTYYAELIDSPPLTLDIDELTAAWNQAHPDMEAFPEADPYNRDAYQLIGDVLSIDKDGAVTARDEELFVLFLEFYREYLPPEYKLAVPMGVLGENGTLMLEKGFRADDFERRELEKHPGYQLEIQPGKYPRKRSVIVWQNPLYGVQDYTFTVDYPLLEADLRQKLPTAAIEPEENDPDACIIYYRSALVRMDFSAQTLLIADSQPDSTWDLMQWYRAMIPLEHRLNITVRSWVTHVTNLPRVNGGVYSRIDLKEIGEIPYPTRSSMSKEELIAFLREVTHDWLQRPGYRLWG